MAPIPIDVRWVVVPISDVLIHDVWRVDGMAGTGSNDMSMDDVFVPEHRTLGRRPPPLDGEAPGSQPPRQPDVRDAAD